MSYGAQVTRADAEGAKNIQNVDINKVGLLCEVKRGIAGIADKIYSFKDFVLKCGSFKSSAYGAYVAKAFFDTLENGVDVEMKVLPFVAADAVQASAEIMDKTATPDKAFDIKAGFKGKADKSEFGNDIAYKITQSENYSYLLASDTGSTPTTAVLTSVENLKVGYIVHFADGTNNEHAIITDINQATKEITFPALTNTYTAAQTTITRVDWNLFIGVKNDQGVFDQVEEYENVPMFKGDTLGMPLLVNDALTGSKYVTVNYDNTNTSPPATITPSEVATWEPLSGGSDGTPATQADYESLVESFVDEDIFILLAPELSSIAHNNAMVNFATDNYKCLYYGQAGLAADEDDLKALGASLRSTYRFGMIPCDKWQKVNDPLKDNTVKDIPPVGMEAAHYFNSYKKYGIGRVAAGNAYPVNTNSKLEDSNGLIHDDRDGVGGRLIRDYGINISRWRQGKGVTINSARSLSTDLGYVFQHQIAAFILISRSILEYYRSFEQDPSGRDAQESHYRVVYTYMKGHYDNGVFFKGYKEDGTETTFEDVVKIRNDYTMNTNLDIAQGRETAFIQFMMRPPIEEPIAQIASAPVTMIG